QKTVQAGGFDLGFIRLLQADTNEMELVVSEGYAEPAHIRRSIPLAAPADARPNIHRVLETKKTVVFDALENHPGLGSLRREGARTAVLVPILAQERALGIMLLGNRAPRTLRPNEIRLLEAIGNQAGLAIEKAQLFKRAQTHAAALERSNEVKSEFLGVMSHELHGDAPAIRARRRRRPGAGAGAAKNRNPVQGASGLDLLYHAGDGHRERNRRSQCPGSRSGRAARGLALPVRQRARQKFGIDLGFPSRPARSFYRRREAQTDPAKFDRQRDKIHRERHHHRLRESLVSRSGWREVRSAGRGLRR